MNDDIVQSKQELLKGLALAISTGMDAWTRAGNLVVQLIDEYRMSLREIADAVEIQGMPLLRMLAGLENVGRGRCLPQLLAEAFPAVRCLQRMPLSEQQRLVNGQVELVTLKDGVPDVLMVAVRDLTAKQCAQVFDEAGVRSTGAQRAWLEEQMTEAEIAKAKVPGAVNYRLKGGKLLVLRECEFSRKELARILSDLE
jgi:hypothetical protein